MARVHLKSLILRCPAPAGASWGVPTPCQSYCVNCIRSPISYMIMLWHTHSFCVASALLLLHVPRFPFHDSTGFQFWCKTTWKTIHFEKLEVASFRLVFKKAHKTCVKSTFSMYYVLLCALACSHASVFAAQGPRESDFCVSSTWPWTKGVTKFSQDSPKMVQDGPK